VHPGSAQSISSAGWPTRGPFSLPLPLTTGSRTLGALLRCLAPAPSHCRPDPVSSRPTCQPRCPASPRPRRPPLSRGKATAHARRLPSLSPATLGPPSLSPPLHPRVARPPPPLLKKGEPQHRRPSSLPHTVIPPLRSDITPAAPFPASRPPPRRSPEPLLPQHWPPPLRRHLALPPHAEPPLG
jgi:hypothetical protein